MNIYETYDITFLMFLNMLSENTFDDLNNYKFIIQDEVEFEWFNCEDEFGDMQEHMTLPYKDFLFFQDDYELHVRVLPEDDI